MRTIFKLILPFLLVSSIANGQQIKTYTTSDMIKANVVTKSPLYLQGPDSLITKAQVRALINAIPEGGGSGTVTSFGFTNTYGITGTVTNSTSTPNLHLAWDSARYFYTQYQSRLKLQYLPDSTGSGINHFPYYGTQNPTKTTRINWNSRATFTGVTGGENTNFSSTYGILGYGSTWGVHGETTTGIGVHGYSSTSGTAVRGTSSSGIGGDFQSSSGNALYALAANGGVPFIAQLTTGNTADIAQFKNGSNVVKARIDKDGEIYANGVHLGAGGGTSSGLKYVYKALPANTFLIDSLYIYTEQNLTTARTFTFDFTSAVIGYTGQFVMIADGVEGHAPSFSQSSPIAELIGGTYNNTLNYKNVLSWMYVSENTVRYWWGNADLNTYITDKALKSSTKKTFAGNISFADYNTEYLPYQMTGNLYIGLDTAGAVPGFAPHYSIIGKNNYHIWHTSQWSPMDTANTYRDIGTTDGTLYTFLGGKFNSGIYSRFKFNLIDSFVLPGIAPTLLSAVLRNNYPYVINLIYNQSLYSGSVPATTDFTTSPSRTISSVAISGDTLKITVSSRLNYNDVISINYTVGSNGIKHSSTGASATSFSGVNVINGIVQIILSTPSPSGSSLSTSSLRFAWANVTYNSGYTCQVSTDNGDTWGTSFNLANNTTQYDITGLGTGERRDFRIYARGSTDGNYGNSATVTSYAVTSALTQLSTPTNGAITELSSTGLTANVSGVDANASYLSLDYKLTSSGTWTNFSSTLARTVTSQAITGLTAGSGYDTRWTAIGNGTTYSNSNASSTVSATTYGTSMTFTSAATSTDGTYLDITCSKNVASCTSGITLYVGGVSKTFAYSIVSNKIRITPTVAFISSDVITLSASSSNALATDNGALTDFTSQSVTNNVAASITYTFMDWQNIQSGLTMNTTTHDLVLTTGSNKLAYDNFSLTSNFEVVIPKPTVSADGMTACGVSLTSGYVFYSDASYNGYRFTNTYYITVINGAPVDYITLDHNFYKIKHAGSTMTWEESNDGISWTVKHTETITSAAYLIKGQIYYQGEHLIGVKAANL